MGPLVTIVIPSYGNQPKLTRSVESVINQSISEQIELIIIDDNGKGSENQKYTKLYTDSLDVNRLFSFKIIYNLTNIERSASRNRGIEEGKGKYIGFLDNDDYFLENKIESQVRILENNLKIGVTYSQSKRLSKDKVMSKSKEINNVNYLTNTLARNLFIHPGSNLLIRREILDRYKIRFDENISFNEDIIFLANVLKETQCKGTEYYGLVVDVTPGRRQANNKDLYDITEEYLSNVKQIIDYLSESDRKYINDTIGLQLARYYFTKKNYNRFKLMLQEFDISSLKFMSYFLHLLYRKTSHQNYGYKMKKVK